MSCRVLTAHRGVWKAPAGLEADIRGIVGVRVPLSDEQNGLLNPEAVNAVRAFPSGVVSWGARTMDGFDNSGNTDYRYVPVRRFALFIEESLFRGFRFAIFEPNDEPLWAQIRLAGGAFMNSLFREARLPGRRRRRRISLRRTQRQQPRRIRRWESLMFWLDSRHCVRRSSSW